MKANEAPEKIYFSATENGTHYYTEGIPFEREYIEYTRTDVFIEKACEFLKEHREEVRTEDNGIMGWIDDCFIENFKNYMEGK